MCFINHYNDVELNIIENKKSDFLSIDLFGTHEDFNSYDNNAPVAFFSLTEGIEKRSVVLNNVLYINGDGIDIDDLYFNTRCVGYAVEHNYDAVVVENSIMNYAILINISENDIDYITEANDKPLKGKKISKERRKSLMDRFKKKKKPKKNPYGPDKPVIKNPKKAPPEGIKIDVLLANTGKLSPKRVERAIKEVRKKPPKITGVKEVEGKKYFRAEYNFKSVKATKTQMGYADISQDKVYTNELFCTCADFFYRLYAPFVAAGLSTWNIPPKYKAKQRSTVINAPHNHHWSELTNPQGSLFLCKHLWAFLAYYVAGTKGQMELTDDEIDAIIAKYFGDVEQYKDEEEPEESSNKTDFEKAYGKLFVADIDKDIEDIRNPKHKQKKGKKQVFYRPDIEIPSEDKNNK